VHSKIRCSVKRQFCGLPDPLDIKLIYQAIEYQGFIWIGQFLPSHQQALDVRGFAQHGPKAMHTLIHRPCGYRQVAAV
jgi:hypothetical protein